MPKKIITKFNFKNCSVNKQIKYIYFYYFLPHPPIHPNKSGFDKNHDVDATINKGFNKKKNLFCK